MVKTQNLISHQLLCEFLRYDQTTGFFYWNCARPKTRVGQRAGTYKHHKKYVLIEILGTCYQAHRLAWFYMTGQWPKDQIDHINMDRCDNRFVNLREATNGQNAVNKKHANRTGFKGVKHCAWLKENPFMAQIRRDNKIAYLGCFPTAEEAHEAYKKAAIEIHGEYARF